MIFCYVRICFANTKIYEKYFEAFESCHQFSKPKIYVDESLYQHFCAAISFGPGQRATGRLGDWACKCQTKVV